MIRVQSHNTRPPYWAEHAPVATSEAWPATDHKPLTTDPLPNLLQLSMIPARDRSPWVITDTMVFSLSAFRVSLLFLATSLAASSYEIVWNAVTGAGE